MAHIIWEATLHSSACFPNCWDASAKPREALAPDFIDDFVNDSVRLACVRASVLGAKVL